MSFFGRNLCAGLFIAAAITGLAHSQTPTSVVTPGSTAFCLFEIPSDEPSRHRWINLGIVQYIETTPTELKIAYGGGSFGSGFEVRIPLAKPEDAQILLDKIRKAAAACR